MNNPKEIDVFNRHDRFSKLKVIGISILIAIVSITALYFFVKSLLTYTVEYNLNGGYVYGSTLEPQKLKFLQKVEEPKNVKKRGYYIEYWSKDEDMGSKFRFGTPIWNSMTLHVKWAEGVAVRLHFAEGEENDDLPLEDLRGYYEQWLKPGESWSLPLVYNTNENSVHYGEQLLWYEEGSDEPFATRDWTNLTECVDIYGKWFDTDPEKFKVDADGTLQKYLGHCNKIILPNNIIKIKDIEREKFTTGESDSLNDQAGTYHSVWQNVMDDENGVNGLKLIYLNSELVEIGDCAFMDCKGLEKVIFLGDNVETIGEWAFANCISLDTIEFPSKVKIIEPYTFFGAFDSAKRVSLVLKNIETIKDKAFMYSKLYTIELNRVTSIGKNAFASCDILTDFVIKTNSVISSNVTGGNTNPVPNPEGIFWSTFTYSTIGNHQHLCIFVPERLYENFMALDYWNMYSGVIQKVASDN